MAFRKQPDSVVMCDNLLSFFKSVFSDWIMKNKEDITIDLNEMYSDK